MYLWNVFFFTLGLCDNSVKSQWKCVLMMLIKIAFYNDIDRKVRKLIILYYWTVCVAQEIMTAYKCYRFSMFQQSLLLQQHMRGSGRCSLLYMPCWIYGNILWRFLSFCLLIYLFHKYLLIFYYRKLMLAILNVNEKTMLKSNVLK